jgi:DNA-binding transcriptional ArsR family regulator
MGATKKNLFTEEQNALADLAKSLGNPARIAILQEMIISKECITGNLVQELGLAQATISQHLRALKEQDIICGTIEGVSVSYCINPEKWNSIKNLFNQLFDQHPICQDGDCC